MVRTVAIAGLILASTMIAGAQSKAETAVGQWKGASLCTVKPSPCRDETVVYDISASNHKKGMLACKADKIVNGEQQNMGTLDCSYTATPNRLTCEIPGKGVWKFSIHGDSMTGTLELADGTLFRKVNARRVR